MASLIGIVLKNGVDIRMCVVYRIVNGFITLSNYPLPLIEGRSVVFVDVMCSMRLDTTSGFWVVKISEKAKLISAFVCQCGQFKLTRMSFGLKKAPLMYLSVINNWLWGFVGLPPEEEAEIIKNLRVATQAPRNIPLALYIGPVLERSAYIDDIAHGIRATPNVAKGVMDLPFPKSNKGVISFLENQNYYHKFIETYLKVTAFQNTRYIRDETSHELMNLRTINGQEYDAKLQHVRYTGRALNDAELRYHITEGVVKAIPRVLQIFRTILNGR
ncbi:reverse transcriptase [Phytophthora megakarya]|uniref:Reverse transcriptase n=1 Tax=Phytophthora megakarya TaxID=4795 RepID=A0A225WBN6_9STRA|nr:reverse transcriptase [Phytophthora megakarya]